MLARRLAGWLAARMPGASDLGIDQSRLSARRGPVARDDPVRRALARGRRARSRRAASCGSSRRSFTVFPDDLFDEQYRLMKVLHEGGYVPRRAAAVARGRPGAARRAVLRHGEGAGPGAGQHPALCRSRAGWPRRRPAQRRAAVGERACASSPRSSASRSTEVAVPRRARRTRATASSRSGTSTRASSTGSTRRCRAPAARAPALAAAAGRSGPTNQPEGIVWGDARIGNMMFDDELRCRRGDGLGAALARRRAARSRLVPDAIRDDAWPRSQRSAPTSKAWARARRRSRCGRRSPASRPPTSNGTRTSPAQDGLPGPANGLPARRHHVGRRRWPSSSKVD